MSNSLKNIINRGVPVNMPLLLRMDDLVSISNNKDDSREKLRVLNEGTLNFLKPYFGKYLPRVPACMKIFSDPNSLERSFGFDIEQFIYMLAINLNLYGDDKKFKKKQPAFSDIDYNELISNNFEALRTRIDVLRNLKDPSQLKKKFPELFSEYKSWSSIYKNVLVCYKFLLNKGFYSKFIKKEDKLRLYKKWQENGLDIPMDALNEYVEEANNFSFESFCQDNADIYDNLINHYDDINDYLSSYTINCDDLDIDEDKFALYIAYLSMLYAYNSKDDYNKQKYIYYVVDYFNRYESKKYDDEFSIDIGGHDSGFETSEMSIFADDGKNSSEIKATAAELFKEYSEFLKDNPDIKAINVSNMDFSGMDLNEVEEFMIEYIKDIKANWDLLPEDAYDEVMTYENIPKETKKSVGKYEVSEERKLQMYIDKKEFYGSTDPIFRIKGKNTFDGYIGFIYPNGKVVLDKFFEKVDTKDLAYGEAIYIMGIKDFYELSQHSKSYLIESPDAKKIDHRGKWQEDVRKEINASGDSYSTASDIKKLVKANKITVE